MGGGDKKKGAKGAKGGGAGGADGKGAQATAARAGVAAQEYAKRTIRASTCCASSARARSAR